jgi:SAM-dependent methyltransferase
VVAEAFWLPFAGESFSMVVDFGLFHHIKLPDQGRYISEVGRVLIPGGALILSVFSTRFRHHPGEVRRRPWLVHRGHYDRFFTQADIRRLFEPAFSVARLVEEVEGLEAYHHALLFKEAA